MVVESKAATTALLSHDDMKRIAKASGCGLHLQNKTTRHCVYVYLNSQGARVYLGYFSVLCQLSEEAFAAKVAAKLEKEFA